MKRRTDVPKDSFHFTLRVGESTGTPEDYNALRVRCVRLSDGHAVGSCKLPHGTMQFRAGLRRAVHATASGVHQPKHVRLELQGRKGTGLPARILSDWDVLGSCILDLSLFSSGDREMSSTVPLLVGAHDADAIHQDTAGKILVPVEVRSRPNHPVAPSLSHMSPNQRNALPSPTTVAASHAHGGLTTNVTSSGHAGEHPVPPDAASDVSLLQRTSSVKGRQAIAAGSTALPEERMLLTHTLTHQGGGVPGTLTEHAAGGMGSGRNTPLASVSDVSSITGVGLDSHMDTPRSQLDTPRSHFAPDDNLTAAEFGAPAQEAVPTNNVAFAATPSRLRPPMEPVDSFQAGVNAPREMAAVTVGPAVVTQIPTDVTPETTSAAAPAYPRAPMSPPRSPRASGGGFASKALNTLGRAVAPLLPGTHHAVESQNKHLPHPASDNIAPEPAGATAVPSTTTTTAADADTTPLPSFGPTVPQAVDGAAPIEDPAVHGGSAAYATGTVPVVAAATANQLSSNSQPRSTSAFSFPNPDAQTATDTTTAGNGPNTAAGTTGGSLYPSFARENEVYPGRRSMEGEKVDSNALDSGNFNMDNTRVRSYPVPMTPHPSLANPASYNTDAGVPMGTEWTTSPLDSMNGNSPYTRSPTNTPLDSSQHGASFTPQLPAVAEVASSVENTVSEHYPGAVDTTADAAHSTIDGAGNLAAGGARGVQHAGERTVDAVAGMQNMTVDAVTKGTEAVIEAQGQVGAGAVDAVAAAVRAPVTATQAYVKGVTNVAVDAAEVPTNAVAATVKAAAAAVSTALIAPINLAEAAAKAVVSASADIAGAVGKTTIAVAGGAARAPIKVTQAVVERTADAAAAVGNAPLEVARAVMVGGANAAGAAVKAPVTAVTSAVSGTTRGGAHALSGTVDLAGKAAHGVVDAGAAVAKAPITATGAVAAGTANAASSAAAMPVEGTRNTLQGAGKLAGAGRPATTQGEIEEELQPGAYAGAGATNLSERAPRHSAPGLLAAPLNLTRKAASNAPGVIASPLRAAGSAADQATAAVAGRVAALAGAALRHLSDSGSLSGGFSSGSKGYDVNTPSQLGSVTEAGDEGEMNRGLNRTHQILGDHHLPKEEVGSFSGLAAPAGSVTEMGGGSVARPATDHQSARVTSQPQYEYGAAGVRPHRPGVIANVLHSVQGAVAPVLYNTTNSVKGLASSATRSIKGLGHAGANLGSSAAGSTRSWGATNGVTRGVGSRGVTSKALDATRMLGAWVVALTALGTGVVAGGLAFTGAGIGALITLLTVGSLQTVFGLAERLMAAGSNALHHRSHRGAQGAAARAQQTLDDTTSYTRDVTSSVDTDVSDRVGSSRAQGPLSRGAELASTHAQRVREVAGTHLQRGVTKASSVTRRVTNPLVTRLFKWTAPEVEDVRNRAAGVTNAPPTATQWLQPAPGELHSIGGTTAPYKPSVTERLKSSTRSLLSSAPGMMSRTARTGATTTRSTAGRLVSLLRHATATVVAVALALLRVVSALARNEWAAYLWLMNEGVSFTGRAVAGAAGLLASWVGGRHQQGVGMAYSDSGVPAPVPHLMLSAAQRALLEGRRRPPIVHGTPTSTLATITVTSPSTATTTAPTTSTVPTTSTSNYNYAPSSGLAGTADVSNTTIPPTFASPTTSSVIPATDYNPATNSYGSAVNRNSPAWTSRAANVVHHAANAALLPAKIALLPPLLLAGLGAAQLDWMAWRARDLIARGLVAMEDRRIIARPELS